MAAPDRYVLPKNVKPIHYDLTLFNLEFQSPWTYEGLVKIGVKVSEPTKEIIMNQKSLEILHAQIQVEGGRTMEAKEISLDSKNERATLTFAELIPVSTATLELSFKGIINDKLSGFSRASYKPDTEPSPMTPKDEDGNCYMVSTKFEPCDCRQAFPCFDEPNLKATFDISIETAEDLVALSNMPEKSTVTGKKLGTKLVSFETTPLMSTYLVVWAIGDFTYVESFTERKYNEKPLPVRIYTTRGLEKQGQYSLEHSTKFIDLFSDTYGIDYPIPKLDMLAVSDFASGGMEQWGLLTYRASVLLVDEKTVSERNKAIVAYMVAHELAHQWFGNLVTMDWWDELWLKESFATWAGWWAVDKLHPEWDFWDEFVVQNVHEAFQLDCLRASHAIHVPVKNAPDVGQIFDDISYCKGSAAIRMIAHHIGVDAFFKGVSNYLKAHAYGNAVGTDLWAAIGEACGIDVISFVEPWIQKIGFPVLTVIEEADKVVIRQNRFLSSGDVKPDEDETIWTIPVSVKHGSSSSRFDVLLNSKEELVLDVDGTFYFLNIDRVGFYRTNYPIARLLKLGQASSQLSVSERLGLVNDADAMAFAGLGTTAGVLALVEGFQEETNFQVWGAIRSSLVRVRRIYENNDVICKGIIKFMQKLVSPAIHKVGIKFSSDDSYLDLMARKTLLEIAQRADYQEVISASLETFAQWKAGDNDAIDRNYRGLVFACAGKYGDVADWEALLETALQSSDEAIREDCISALCGTKDHELGLKVLNKALAGEIKTQDAMYVFAWVGSNNDLCTMFWSYFKQNWTAIWDRFGGIAHFDMMLRMCFSQRSDAHLIEDMKAFFADKDTSTYNTGLQVIYDTISTRAQYRQRDEQNLAEWFQSNEYA